MMGGGVFWQRGDVGEVLIQGLVPSTWVFKRVGGGGGGICSGLYREVL